MAYIGERFHEQIRTDGKGGVEADVWLDFDEVFQRHSKWFTILREVRGWYVGARPHCPVQQPRIDRILMPTKALRECGWHMGPVGVECKRRDEKIGRAVCQALDYSHSAFPLTAGLTVNLEWIFIWPVSGVTGDLASIMAQNRIGWASSWNGVDVQLKGGDGKILDATPENIQHIRTPRCGYKVGSR